MGRLEGKVAIVTGGGRGIGEASTIAMAREGARVVVADIDFGRASEVAESLVAGGSEAMAVQVDISAEEQVAALVGRTVDRFGRLDVLFNNAADTRVETIRRDLGVSTMDVELWDHTMAVNLRGPMLCCKHVVPVMASSGGGSIVNTSSVASLAGDPILTAYSASKAAVNALTRSVAVQFGAFRVRCNAIAPHATLSAGNFANSTPESRALLLRHLLTPYPGEPEMQADVVIFLASDESRFVTGQVIAVDGGTVAHVPTYAELLETALQDGDPTDIAVASQARS